MGFVIGVVVALIVVFLLAYITIKKPVFGEVIIALSVLMVLAAVFFYFQKDNRVENKKNLIPIEQIKLSDFSHSLAYGNYYKLTAHLKNQSPRYRLQSIVLQISFFQCPASFDLKSDDLKIENKFKSCHLLSEKQHTIETRLAAQQAADIESYILLDDDVLLDAGSSLSPAEGSLPQAEGSLSRAKGSIQWQIKIINGIAR